MHCSNCEWQKGTSRAEATSNSEKNKPVALAIVGMKASGSQLVRQLKILLNKILL